MENRVRECQMSGSRWQVSGIGCRVPSFKIRRGLVLAFLLISCGYLLSATSFSQSSLIIDKDNSDLLEVGSASNVTPADKAPTEFKVVSYNIRWRGGDELRELVKQLKHDPEIGGAAIIGLQEVDRNKKRTGNINTIKLMAAELGKHYAWAAPPTTNGKLEEETGVAILSNYPLTDVRRILLPHGGPGDRRRVAVGATVTIAGKALRFYSVHSENRMSVKKKLEQMTAVLDDLRHHPKIAHAIVVGDLNTWEGDAVKRTTTLFTKENFVTPFANGHSTFLYKLVLIPIKFKLDWVWLRGLEATSHGIDKEIKFSDHWPLWAVVRLKN
ncbi:MAG TPA: endonuclease/exonuclease/phosphatase family protein [Pyrinomonadaceae bacterium]|nr:endonuclease/exonuclease/phosphatase family protein [Pyrinomonadaceae bacterium]